MPEDRIVWLCDVCGGEIEDGAGVVCIGYGEIREAERAKDNASPAKWHVVHFGCPCDAFSRKYDIPVEALRTPEGVLRWSDHLDQKTWLPFTNWHEFIRGVCGPTVH